MVDTGREPSSQSDFLGFGTGGHPTRSSQLAGISETTGVGLGSMESHSEPQGYQHGVSSL